MNAPELTNPLVNGKIAGENVPQSEYCSDAFERGDVRLVMSRGALVEFARCPHRWKMGYESPDTAPKEWGSLIDALVFNEGVNLAVCPETYPDSKTGVAKPWNFNANFCDEWREEQNGKQIVKSDKFTQAENAVKFLLGDPQIAELINCSAKQVMVTAEYHDTETRIVVPLKMLVDLVPKSASKYGKSLADLKTCATASPWTWQKAVFDHGYHTQAAMYLDGYVSATGEDRIEFRHVLQESFPPWEVGKRLVSQEYLELGRLTYLRALQRYCQCLKTGFWPGYDDFEARPGSMILDGWQITNPEAWMIGQ